MKAIITYRTSTQKITDGFKSNLTPEVLRDICFKLTGQTEYIVKELHDTYNKGRLLTLEYDGMTSFVTLSEKRIAGRNSSMQSVPTALNLFYSSDIRHKQLCYYVFPHEGNAYTDYHSVYYRRMLTAGF